MCQIYSFSFTQKPLFFLASVRWHQSEKYEFTKLVDGHLPVLKLCRESREHPPSCNLHGAKESFQKSNLPQHLLTFITSFVHFLTVTSFWPIINFQLLLGSFVSSESGGDQYSDLDSADIAGL